MVYLVAIMIGIASGLVAGGSFNNFFDIRLKKGWMFFIAFSIQIVAGIAAAKGLEYTSAMIWLVAALSYLILMAGFWFNRYYSGMWVIAIGMLLNASVILTNGGRMPVDMERLGEKAFDFPSFDIKHVLMNSNTKLPFFADIITPPSFFAYFNEIMSVGDIVIAIGFSIVIFELFTKTGKTEKLANNRQSSHT